MPLLTLTDAQLAYGMSPLLDGSTLTVQENERIGLIGRNGTGKSSLLGVIAGSVTLDGGELRRQEGLRVALVSQEPALPAAASLRESLVALARVPAGEASFEDDREHWRFEASLNEFLHRFQVDADIEPGSASGGEVKRAALALAFALKPDLILLDEPTNHLDIDGIALLEAALARGPAAIVVTHDRWFLDRFATRIVELDRGILRSYAGNFSDYARIKTDELAAEEIARRRFDKLWAQEEAWIRRGIEARRTRNEGRVTRLENLRRERAARRDRIGNVKLAIDAGGRSGRLVVELEGVSKRYGDRGIVEDLSLTLRRGDRVGLIGPNGAGKSTLLKIILGELAPDSGRVRLGTSVAPAYFDQMREQLDPERTVAETVSPGSEWVEVNGVRKHVLAYMGDFLFSPQRVNSPVRMLSGGERNRLLLARLFARPANVLVLDEPTNDLDLESLEMLEAALQDYPGTLLLVSHDRAFLDNIVTQTLVAEGGGVWREYVGGYSDWLNQTRASPPARAGVDRAASRGGGRSDADRRPSSLIPQPSSLSPEPSASRGTERSRVKLTYKETRELEAMPATIEALEAEQRALAARMNAPDYYQAGGAAMKADHARNEELEALIHAQLERWEELEAKARTTSGSS
ncbi:MAG TPA: ATP-binding cassette domain-containing protein [Burkholderiales bacterium]|nr:ATP-binding cassette domain-containing protein [Burkholderiales bacterium]